MKVLLRNFFIEAVANGRIKVLSKKKLVVDSPFALGAATAATDHTDAELRKQLWPILEQLANDAIQESVEKQRIAAEKEETAPAANELQRLLQKLHSSK